MPQIMNEWMNEWIEFIKPTSPLRNLKKDIDLTITNRIGYTKKIPFKNLWFIIQSGSRMIAIKKETYSQSKKLIQAGYHFHNNFSFFNNINGVIALCKETR